MHRRRLHAARGDQRRPSDRDPASPRRLRAGGRPARDLAAADDPRHRRRARHHRGQRRDPGSRDHDRARRSRPAVPAADRRAATRRIRRAASRRRAGRRPLRPGQLEPGRDRQRDRRQPRRERRRDLERRAADAREDDRRGNVAAASAPALGLGGGVGLEDTSAPATFTNTTFSGNDAVGLGGGIYTQRSMTTARTSRSSATRRRHRDPRHQQRRRSVSAVHRRAIRRRRNTLVARNADGGCGGTLRLPDRLDQRAAGRDRRHAAQLQRATRSRATTSSPTRGVGAARGQRRPDAHARASRRAARRSTRVRTCPADDQRGFPRRVFACDIGAYEFGADNLTADVSVFTDELHAARVHRRPLHPARAGRDGGRRRRDRPRAPARTS